MADLAITALPTASQLSSSDLLYVAIPNPLSPIGFSLCKMTSVQFGLFLNKDLFFASDLETDSKNIIGAINELKAGGGGGGASVIQLTAAEYAQLTQEEKINGSIYKLTDKAIFYCLDEEYHAVKELTSAQYEALSTAQQNNGTIYIQTDAETTGSDIAVSDTDSTSIAEAIDELAEYSYESKTCLISLGTGSSLTLNVQCYGKLVIASFTGYMTNSATVSAGDILFDGLPLIRDFSEVFYITSRGKFRIYNDNNEGKVRIYDLQSVNSYIGFTLSYISS